MKKTAKRFGRVGVLAGGPSNEREVSLRSGRAVFDALSREGIDAAFVELWDDIRAVIAEKRFDTAFIALHGRFGEDGTVQRELEDACIPYTGSGPDASRRALDKIAAKSAFVAHSIPTPQYLVFEGSVTRPADLAVLGYPLVVKPQFEGSSIGLGVVRSPGELGPALDNALRYDGTLLVEEFIDGRELTVGILRDEPLPVVEIVPKERVYDYEAKYTDPGTAYRAPAPLDKKTAFRAQELALRAHRCLGCRSFSRVDMLLDASGELFVLEVNTIPGMTERSLLPKAAAVTGCSFGDLCIQLIEDAVHHGKTKT